MNLGGLGAFLVAARAAARATAVAAIAAVTGGLASNEQAGHLILLLEGRCPGVPFTVFP